MCGIVGYIGKRDATPILMGGLHRVEYRGYDSAGIAVMRSGELLVAKCKGRVRDLENSVPKRFKGRLGSPIPVGPPMASQATLTLTPIATRPIVLP